MFEWAFEFFSAKNRSKQNKKKLKLNNEHCNCLASLVPSLNELSFWFDYHDRDRNGYLDRNEIVAALMTTHPFTLRSRESVRNWVHNVWPLYDLDGNGYIDKCEFVSPGGLGDTLKSLNQRAPVSQNTQQTTASYASHNVHTQLTTETMQVSIPNGTQPGQQLLVRGSSGRETLTTIPPYSQWRSGQGAMPFFLFNIKEEKSALVITTATVVGEK